MGLYFRFAQRFAWDLPFVLGPIPRQANVISTGPVLVQACLDYTHYANAIRLNHRNVPGSHLPIASLALGALLQGAAGDPAADEAPRRGLSEQEFKELYLSLSCVHPMIASVIERLRSPLALTEKLRAFFKDDSMRQKMESGLDPMYGDACDSGMPFMTGGMELFTDWIWPTDSNWLSGMSGMMMPDWEASSRAPDFSFGIL